MLTRNVERLVDRQVVHAPVLFGIVEREVVPRGSEVRVEPNRTRHRLIVNRLGANRDTVRHDDCIVLGCGRDVGRDQNLVRPGMDKQESCRHSSVGILRWPPLMKGWVAPSHLAVFVAAVADESVLGEGNPFVRSVGRCGTEVGRADERSTTPLLLAVHDSFRFGEQDVNTVCGLPGTDGPVSSHGPGHWRPPMKCMVFSILVKMIQ